MGTDHQTFEGVIGTEGIGKCSKLNLCIQPARRPQGKKVPKRLDVCKLKQDSKMQAFINDICSRLDGMKLTSDDPKENWTVFRDIVHSSTMDSLIPVSRKTKTGLTKMTKKSRDSLKRNTKNTRHTLVIPSQYPLRRHIQILQDIPD